MAVGLVGEIFHAHKYDLAYVADQSWEFVQEFDGLNAMRTDRIVKNAHLLAAIAMVTAQPRRQRINVQRRILTGM